MQAWKKRILVSLGGRGTYFRINEGDSPRAVSTLLESVESGKEKRKEEKNPQQEQEQEQEQQQQQEQEKQTGTEMEMEQKKDVNILEANEDDENKEEYLLSESSASSFENSSDMEEYIE